MSDAPDVIAVDDEEELRHVIARYLGRHGITVRTAADAVELDRLVAERRPDIVLLDVVMPGEDGVSVARRLRAADPALGLVMLTAAGDVIDRVVGLEIGADDYMAKPFDLRELLARIRSLHRRLGTMPATAGTPQAPRRVHRPPPGSPAACRSARSPSTRPVAGCSMPRAAKCR